MKENKDGSVLDYGCKDCRFGPAPCCNTCDAVDCEFRELGPTSKDKKLKGE